MKSKSVISRMSVILICLVLFAAGFRLGEAQNAYVIDETEAFIRAEVLRVWGNIDLHIMEPFDIDSLIAAVEGDESEGKGKFQYAHRIPKLLSPGNSGNWYSIPGVGDI